MIQQIGTPRRHLRAPANRFVAGFFGTPSMNFLAPTSRRAASDSAARGPASRSRSRRRRRCGPRSGGRSRRRRHPARAAVARGARRRRRARAARSRCARCSAPRSCSTSSRPRVRSPCAPTPAPRPRPGDTVQVWLDPKSIHLFDRRDRGPAVKACSSRCCSRCSSARAVATTAASCCGTRTPAPERAALEATAATWNAAAPRDAARARRGAVRRVRRQDHVGGAARQRPRPVHLRAGSDRRLGRLRRDRAGRVLGRRRARRSVQRQSLGAMAYKGSLWGLPLAVKSLALFYRTDLVPSPPATTDDLIAIAKPLRAKRRVRARLRERRSLRPRAVAARLRRPRARRRAATSRSRRPRPSARWRSRASSSPTASSPPTRRIRRSRRCSTAARRRSAMSGAVVHRRHRRGRAMAGRAAADRERDRQAGGAVPRRRGHPDVGARARQGRRVRGDGRADQRRRRDRRAQASRARSSRTCTPTTIRRSRRIRCSGRSARSSRTRCRCRRSPAMRSVWTPYQTALGEVLDGRAEPGSQLLRVEREVKRYADAGPEVTGVVPPAARLRGRRACRDRDRDVRVRRRAQPRARRAPDRSRPAQRRGRSPPAARRCRPCTAASSARPRASAQHPYLRHRRLRDGSAWRVLAGGTAAQRDDKLFYDAANRFDRDAVRRAARRRHRPRDRRATGRPDAVAVAITAPARPAPYPWLVIIGVLGLGAALAAAGALVGGRAAARRCVRRHRLARRARDAVAVVDRDRADPRARRRARGGAARRT